MTLLYDSCIIQPVAEELFTIKDLVRLGRLAHAACGTDGDSRRVRWEPNERLIRYYTTLGLLDSPAEMRGRTALYGTHHLLQLMAIKGLQAEGLSLKEIQARLPGMPEGELEGVAGLPPGWEKLLGVERTRSAPRESRRFWEEQPAAGDWEFEGAPEPARTFSLVGVELAPGVRLLLDAHTYSGVDPAELQEAAGPLLELLSSRAT